MEVSEQPTPLGIRFSQSIDQSVIPPVKLIPDHYRPDTGARSDRALNSSHQNLIDAVEVLPPAAGSSS